MINSYDYTSILDGSFWPEELSLVLHYQWRSKANGCFLLYLF